jgi:hypothetical protein
MKEKLIRFILYSIIMSVGIFFGEYLLDYITHAERLSIVREIRDAGFIGVFVALLMVFVNNFKTKIF